MIRALSILAAVAALAVTAAPVASAGTSKKPPSPTLEGVSIGAGKDRGWFANLGAANDVAFNGTSKQGAIFYNGHAGLGAKTTRSEGSVRGMVNASGGWDPTLRAVHARGAHVITNLAVK